MHIADRGGQCFRIDVLEQVSRGACGRCGEDLRVVGKAREHDDADARNRIEQPADRTDAVAGRHHQVEEHHVGLRRGGFDHRLVRAARLPHHLDPVLQAEERAQALAND